MTKYYATKKRALQYIDAHKCQYTDLKAFARHLQEGIK